MRPVRGFLASLVAILLLVAACGGDSSSPSALEETPSGAAPSPTAATPAAVATPVQGRAVPDGQRIFAHVLQLADVIGPRPAGSAQDRQAADYIAAQLRSFGYDVRLQEYPIASEASRESRLSVLGPGGRVVTTLPFSRSAAGSVRAALIPAGLGRPNEFPSDVRGNIALIERGDLLFQEKVVNAQQAGARGVVVYNNVAGTFLGSLASDSTIPALSVSQEDGRALLDQAQRGRVEVELSVASLGDATSFNVIATPPGRQCETVSGGHYDSVPLAPGASDNATGTAAVLEIAQVLAQNGRMANHCFVLFGAEEIGLVGSRAFVDSLSAADKARLKGMFNYDMVGVGESWILIGNADLQSKAAALAQELGIPATRGQLGANTSSDHASFTAAGIPAFMLHRVPDPLLHTPQDVSSRVRPEALEEAARLGVALLESIAGSS